MKFIAINGIKPNSVEHLKELLDGSEPKELPDHECLRMVPEGGSKEFKYGQFVEISKG